MGNTHPYTLTEEEKLKAATMIEERKNHQTVTISTYIPPGFSNNPRIGPKPLDLSGSKGKVQDYRITQIECPNQFYVQCLSSLEMLMSLEKKLNFWYDLYWYHDSSSLNPLHVEYPSIGAYYACYDETKTEKWYRCRMIGYVSYYEEDVEIRQVEMQCIDYGFHIVVDTKVIYKLRQKYIDELPMQAIEAKLFNGNKSCVWTASDLKYFEEMAKEHKWKDKVKMFQLERLTRPFKLLPVVEFVILGNSDQAESEDGCLEAFDMKGKIILP